MKLHQIGYKNVLWLLDYIRTDVVLLSLSIIVAFFNLGAVLFPENRKRAAEHARLPFYAIAALRLNSNRRNVIHYIVC